MSKPEKKFNRRLAAALAYARRGWPVIPVQPPVRGKLGTGKAPLTSHGYKDATTDPLVIRQWFRDNPKANIGIVAGTAAGLVILDVDPRNGGRKALKKLEAKLGKLPRTLTATTADGGVHLYFRHPSFTIGKDTAGKLLKRGVDVIGDGGYVVAPPSRHASGVAYGWRDGHSPSSHNLTQFPRGWRRHLKARLNARAKRTLRNEPQDRTKNFDEVSLVREGARNTSLTRLAGIMRRASMSQSAIAAALKLENLAHCSPPLADPEVEKIAESVARYSAPSSEAAESGDLGHQVMEHLLRSRFGGGTELIHSQDGHFWHFNGKYWQTASERWIEGLVLEILQTLPIDGKQRFASIIKEALTLLKAKHAVNGDPLRFVAEPRRVINCRNGELWLLDDGSVELRPHRASSYLRHYLDVDYDPQATCPRYDAAVRGIFKNARNRKSMVRHWHELVGYIVQPTRNHALIIVLFGAGSNGKTKLITTVMRLLGPGLVYAGRVEELEADRFGVGSLLGKLLFVDDDVRAGIKLPDGALKKISERKELTGEKKFKDKFNFVARVVPVLLCNNVPSLPDLSHGMLRRLQVIPMTRKFVGKTDDKGLFESLWATEMSGILNRAIEGWHRLHRRGHFRLPEDVIRAQREWLKYANPLEGFISESCTIDPARSCLLADFYKAYCHWAKESGITRAQQRLTIKRNLEHRGFTTARSNRGVKILGIGLEPLRHT